MWLLGLFHLTDEFKAASINLFSSSKFVACATCHSSLSKFRSSVPRSVFSSFLFPASVGHTISDELNEFLFSRNAGTLRSTLGFGGCHCSP